MFIAGIIYNSAALVGYLLWIIWFLPFDLAQTYDFTVAFDAAIILCSLLVDTTYSKNSFRTLLNTSLAAATVASIVLRFVNTDCSNCGICDESYEGTCLHNGCGCAPRQMTATLMNIVPFATVFSRLNTISRRYTL